MLRQQNTLDLWPPSFAAQGGKRREILGADGNYKYKYVLLFFVLFFVSSTTATEVLARLKLVTRKPSFLPRPLGGRCIPSEDERLFRRLVSASEQLVVAMDVEETPVVLIQQQGLNPGSTPEPAPAPVTPNSSFVFNRGTSDQGRRAGRTARNRTKKWYC